VGVVEQFEKFIFVQGVCFSPICQWGNAKRPSGIKSDTVSNRCIQYFVVRKLNSNVPPEKLEKSCTQMLKDGKKWKSDLKNNNNNDNGRSFWPEKALEVYQSLHPSSAL
jgi:hypothetical protein